VKKNNKDVIPDSISSERWQHAQKWERAFWDRQNIPSPWWKRRLRPLLVLCGLRPSIIEQQLDDRNYWWQQQFNDYKDIPRDLTNVCELGCGPYTNVRLILKNRNIKYIHCSDPLGHHYITYKHAWLAKAHRTGAVSVDFHPAEECVYKSDHFDLTIMINVLDHVFDPIKCLQEAIRITAPGGHLVFGQDLTGDQNKRPSNPGHPFVFSHDHLEPVLKHGCREVFRQIVTHDDRDMHYGSLIFIGKKREY